MIRLHCGKRSKGLALTHGGTVFYNSYYSRYMGSRKQQVYHTFPSIMMQGSDLEAFKRAGVSALSDTQLHSFKGGDAVVMNVLKCTSCILFSRVTSIGGAWTPVGTTRPKQGRKIVNVHLSKALGERCDFTSSELASWKVYGVKDTDYILSGNLFFTPDLEKVVSFALVVVRQKNHAFALRFMIQAREAKMIDIMELPTTVKTSDFTFSLSRATSDDVTYFAQSFFCKLCFDRAVLGCNQQGRNYCSRRCHRLDWFRRESRANTEIANTSAHSSTS